MRPARLETQYFSMVTETSFAMRGGENHDPEGPKTARLSILPCPCTKRLVGIGKDAIVQNARPVSNVNQHLEPPFRMATGHRATVTA